MFNGNANCLFATNFKMYWTPMSQRISQPFLLYMLLQLSEYVTHKVFTKRFVLINEKGTYICMIIKLFLISWFVYITINIHMLSNYNNISFSFQGQYIIYDWLLTWRANTYEIVNLFFRAKVGNLCLATHCRLSLELVLQFFHLPFLLALQVFVPTINATF